MYPLNTINFGVIHDSSFCFGAFCKNRPFFPEVFLKLFSKTVFPKCFYVFYEKTILMKIAWDCLKLFEIVFAISNTLGPEGPAFFLQAPALQNFKK